MKSVAYFACVIIYLNVASTVVFLNREPRHGSPVVGVSCCETHGNANLDPRSAFSHDYCRFALRERERERSVLENQRIEHSLSVLASQTTGNIGLLTLKRAIGMVMLVDNGATRHLGIIIERIMFVFRREENFLIGYTFISKNKLIMINIYIFFFYY